MACENYPKCKTTCNHPTCTWYQNVIERWMCLVTASVYLWFQSASVLVDRGERLEKSYRLYKTLADCPTHQALWSPQVTKDKMATSVAPPKLTQPCRTPDAKFTTVATLKPQSLVQTPPYPCGKERTDFTYKDISSFQRRSTRLKPMDGLWVSVKTVQFTHHYMYLVQSYLGCQSSIQSGLHVVQGKTCYYQGS